MSSRRSKHDDSTKVQAQIQKIDDPLAAQVEKWIGESKVLEQHPGSEKNIWEFLTLLSEIRKQMISSNGKNIFLKIFDDNAPLNKTPNSNAEKEHFIVIQIRRQIFDCFNSFIHPKKPDDPQVLKQLQALKHAIETLTGVIRNKAAIGKIESGLIPTAPMTKPTGFFSSNPYGFGGLQEDVKKLLNYLDVKIESLSIQSTKPRKAGGS